MLKRLLVSSAVLVFLAACGGGGSENTVTPPPPPPPPPPPVKDLSLPWPDGGVYHGEDLPSLMLGEHVNFRAPVYEDGPDGARLMVGVDQGARHLDDLPATGERGEFDIHHGQLPDGVGRKTVREFLYETVYDTKQRWTGRPTVAVAPGTNAEDLQRLIRAVQLVNNALPISNKIIVTDQGGHIEVDFNPALAVNGFPPADSPPPATTDSPAPSTAYSYVILDDVTDKIVEAFIDVETGYALPGDKQGVEVIARELMRVMGLNYGTPMAHINSILAIPDSTIPKQQDIPQPVSILYPADREALRALYSGLDDRTDLQNFGPWEDTSMHIVGVGEHAVFGVRRSDNGYSEPWAYGCRPLTDLADNTAISGTVTWNGSLVGFTTTERTITGDAAISVDVDTLSDDTLVGTADFTSLETFPAGAEPGHAGTGLRWGDGELTYSIAVRGNTFWRTSFEQGDDGGGLTGVFVGEKHEGATGTLVRTDLTAAFGATRQ
ncbi:MAG: hypothetical protein OXC28_02115 [Defluviicoccus sp.]|nr:hypothetical protein [Defluviicoccus sp.]